MIDSQYRATFQKVLINPMVNRLIHTTVSADQITTLALCLGAFTGIFIANDFRVVGLFCLIGSGFCDVLDGSLARRRGIENPKGAAYDIFCDRCVEIAVVAGLYMREPLSNGPYAFIMIASILICITSFLVVGIFETNSSVKSFHYSAGLMERSEAFIFFVIMVIWPESFSSLAVLFSLLVGYTGVKRMYEFRFHSS